MPDALSTTSSTLMRAPTWQRRVERALLALGLLAYVGMRHTIDGDAGVRYNTLVHLLASGQISSARYPVIQELVTIPLYVLGAWAHEPAPFVAHFNLIFFAVGLATMVGLLRRHMDLDVLRRFALLVVAGSMFPYHSQNYYGEIFTSILIALGLLLFALDRTRGAVVAVVLGLINTPVTVGAFALVAIRGVWRSKRWIIWVAPVVLALVLVMIEAMIRRGSPFHSGYEGDAGFRTVLPYSGRTGFSYPLVLGVISELLSFGKGILFFAPGLLLLGARRERFRPNVEEFLIASLVFLSGLILVYAKWWSWYGGWYWGPRFLLFAAFPSSLLLAFHLTNAAHDRRAVRMLTVGVLWLAVWVGASGAVFGQDGQAVCQQNNYQLEYLCWYVPEFSPLVLPFIGHRLLHLADWLILLYFAAVGLCLTVPVLSRWNHDHPVTPSAH
jgi:hypothetical protein